MKLLQTTSTALLILYAFTFALSAQGASFDCAKAQTKVEHLICDNPEISKLDDELSVAYKAALKDEKQAASIRQSQKRWIKDRNGCQEVVCLKKTYQARIHELKTSQVQVEMSPQSAQPKVENAGMPATAKKYPPYPDVWQWVLPDGDAIAEAGSSLLILDNGDFLLTYQVPGSSGMIEKIQPTTFFGKQSVVDKDAGIRIRRRMLKVLQLSDDTSVNFSREENFGDVSLTNGFRLGHFNTLDGGGLSGCYRGPAQYIHAIEDSKGKLQRSVVIFKLLDKPKTVHIDKGCAFEPDGDFTTLVESVRGVWHHALADGGFVMLADKDVMLRFDKNLNSQAPLINDRYFVLDMSVADDWIYMNKVTGKDYKLELGKQYMREGLPYDYQSIVNDLYQYLLTLKTKKGAAK